MDGVAIMKYFKDSNNNIFFFDSVEEQMQHQPDLIQITDAEKDSILAPSPAELKAEAISTLKQNRETSLQALTHTFSTGEVVQVRPQDLPNFQIAISLGASEDWVMADDTVVNLTVAQMQEAMDSGIAQGKVIWKTYTADLKAII
jgi:hypothetical protein